MSPHPGPAAVRPAADLPAPDLRAQQQALLALLWARPAGAEPGPAGLRDTATHRGLKAYQANAGALAERALGAAYPVLTEVLSRESLAALARLFWRHHPPTRGDLAEWGEALPEVVAGIPTLDELPWLADLCRLEWAVHRAQTCQDRPTDLGTLNRLAHEDPARLRLRLAPGTQVLPLRWAVEPVWQAHQPPPDSPARQAALQALGPDASTWAVDGRASGPVPGGTVGPAVLVWRLGYRVQVAPLPAAPAGFMQALLAGQSLLQAMETCDPHWPDWLPLAVQRGWLLGVDSFACPTAGPLPGVQP